MAHKKMKPLDREVEERLHREAEEQRYRAKARILLERDGTTAGDGEDEQDRRVQAIRDAVHYARMWHGARDRATRARQTYRVAKVFGNRDNQESAEREFADALRDEEYARSELENLLPQCSPGLVLQQQEWRQALVLLDKPLRDLIGVGEETANSVEEPA